jgi:iron uptake system EfeUOB component EfeO/EfeM
MEEEDFEGTLVLEKLAEIGKVDAFFEAIDSDDFGLAKSLMKRARVDSETITMVLKKMGDADSEHWKRGRKI